MIDLKRVLRDKSQIELGNLNEAELLELFYSEKNGKALGVLLNRYLPLVFAVCMNYLKNRQKAQDASSDILEKMLLYFKAKKVENAKALILISTKNHCLSLLKRSKELVDFQAVQNRLAQENEQDEIIKRETDLNQMERCLMQLPETQRKCLEQFYLYEKSYSQIEIELNLTFKEVKTNIQNGKRMLRKMLLDSRKYSHEKL